MSLAAWYFDLISPFAYLHLKLLHKLPASLEIEYVPVLLAGLLKHWGHKGPAEIPAKRTYTYRYVTWLAGNLGISFKMPPSHPFNSLYALRLLTAAGPNPANVAVTFDMIWKEGRDLQNAGEIAELGKKLGIDNVQAVLADGKVKAALKANTDRAIAAGVFGVPTFMVGECLFWGQDSIEMMQDYLRDPGIFDTPQMKRAVHLPIGVMRPQLPKS